jgi:hypothetical protein
MNTIKLQFPITIDGVEYKELTMRRSKVKDRLAVAAMTGKTDEEKEIRLFTNLCNVAPEVIQELDEADYPAVQKVYMSFFGAAATSSAK